jgi:hypothetical protein
VKAYRLIQTPFGGVSFLPTHFVLGVSFHTAVISRGQRIRFVHIHLPMFYITFSWSSSHATKFNPF